MEKIIINGKDAIFGRMATFVAKQLIRGKSIEIINSEQVLISGSLENFSKRIIQKRNMGRGSSLKGPLFIRKEDRIVKRMIRGMLPIEKTTGRDAFHNLKCYIGNGPLNETEVKKAITMEHQVPLRHFTIKEALKKIL